MKMLERAARRLAELELFRRNRGQAPTEAVDALYEEHGRIYRTDARAALLAALDPEDAEVRREIFEATRKHTMPTLTADEHRDLVFDFLRTIRQCIAISRDEREEPTNG